MSRQHDLESLILLNALLAGKAAHEAAVLLTGGMDPRELLERIRRENFAGRAEALAGLESRFNPQRERDLCERSGVTLLPVTEPSYPAMLREIYDPPLLLYLKGSWLPEDDAALAVIGSRHGSAYGELHARKFASALAAAGWTIVSGLARGIDRAAHEGALEIAYGRTVAVLGSGIDVVYPREHQRLYEEIQEHGAVISELPLGSRPLAHHFPKRNRILSGLSLGVLVIEAHFKSGSLITAREALDQGREVMAMPGPVDRLTSRGTHQLLKEGAGLADTPEAVLEILSGAWRCRPRKTGSTGNLPVKDFFPALPEERTSGLAPEVPVPILETLRSEGPLCYDEIAGRGLLPLAELAGCLLELEIGGKVRKRPDGRFSLREKSF